MFEFSSVPKDASDNITAEKKVSPVGIEPGTSCDPLSYLPD